jgi:hypothetical protein
MEYEKKWLLWNAFKEGNALYNFLYLSMLLPVCCCKCCVTFCNVLLKKWATMMVMKAIIGFL